LRHAYDILSRIHADGVVHGVTFPFQWNDSLPALLTEYNNDHPLIPKSPQLVVSLQAFLDFAIRLTSIVGQLHSKTVRHGALRPDSITINPDGDIWINDFTNTSFLTDDQASNELRAEPDYFPYLAPECTGRINRRIDHRSDLYSLGAALFHIITGEPLWGSLVTNELDLANKLVNQPPPSTCFHPAVDAVIAKLLSKMPENRYQTCEGLLSDWEEIRADPTKALTVGEIDQASQFRLPQTLYGRKSQQMQIRNLFEETHKRRWSKVLFIKGDPGVGKTSLVAEFARGMKSSNTIFCQGKFEEHKRVPYSAIVEALRGLTGHILTESAARLQQWRRELQDALGDEITILLSIAPDLELVLGIDLPEARPDLEDPIGQEERQKRVLVQFLRVFTKRQTLAIFLDDVHWSCKSDSRLLLGVVREFAQTQAEAESNQPCGILNSVFLVCAYRTSNVDSQHHIRTLFEDRVDSTSISLQPLGKEDAGGIVSDVIHQSIADCSELTDLVYCRTRGNPFYLGRVFSQTFNCNADAIGDELVKTHIIQL
jgi:hypothetical protein